VVIACLHFARKVLPGGRSVGRNHGGQEADRTIYRHVAFKVPEAELDAYVERVYALGLGPRAVRLSRPCFGTSRR